MDNDVIVTIGGKEYKYPKDTSLEIIKKDFQNDFKFPILVAKVNGMLTELSAVIKSKCEISFFDCSSITGSRVYEKGLIFLLIFAIKELYGSEEDIIVKYPIFKGIAIETTFRLNEDKVFEIKDKMKEIAKQGWPITKIVVDRLEAVRYFDKIKYYSQRDNLKYNTNSTVNLYRLGNLFDYFYTPLPISTNVFNKFEISYCDSYTLIVRPPVPFLSGKIPEHKQSEKIFEAFNESIKWEKKLQITSVAKLNTLSTKGKVCDIIRIDEIFKNNKLLSIAETINKKKDTIKVVLLSGPSSSGKTTTARKLSMCLRGFGMNPISLSIDDYYLEKKDFPKDSDGKINCEGLDSIDVDLFNKQLKALLNGEEVVTPVFNFVSGKKQFVNKLKLNKKDILIIEGLHAINEKLTISIPKEEKIKIYLSPLTELNIDNHNRISTSDNRLLRRIVRDNRTRGFPVFETLDIWKKVREGEEKYVFPFQGEADIIFNTSAIYEIGVLKVYVEPLLYSVPIDSAYYDDAKRLLNLLKTFMAITSDSIPEDAIIREFIGGSCFDAK